MRCPAEAGVDEHDPDYRHRKGCGERLYYDAETGEWHCPLGHRWTEDELEERGVEIPGRGEQ